MIPDERAFGEAAGALEVGDGDRIVVYDGEGLVSAARAWWMFLAFGTRRVAVLDGGLPASIASGGELELGIVTPEPRVFTAHFDPSFLARVPDVQAALADGSAQVVDARRPERFQGRDPEPWPVVNIGHMPGAVNLPMTTVVRAGSLLEADDLRAAFAAAGVDVDRPVVTTCGSGVTAPILIWRWPGSASRSAGSTTAPGPNGARAPTCPRKRCDDPRWPGVRRRPARPRPRPARGPGSRRRLARPERRAGDPHAAGLDPLSRHALSKEAVEGVSERTGGVPLFVEEVTRLLLERGEAGGLQAIPPTLQQSLAARLDRL